MGMALNILGRRLARFLAKRTPGSSISPPTEPAHLLACLKPGDVFLVEGNSRFSTAIKYLTQSTWSHAAIYVGEHLAEAGGNPSHCFIEADLMEGVRSVAIGEYAGLHSRICRPVGLSESECRKVTAFAIARLGNQYDLRNVIDLTRYLLPTPPVPLRFRRRMIALGSGDPTRAICSTMIAQAFQSIRYPILPIIERRSSNDPDCLDCFDEILQIRHHSLFAPRDFDVSPYFQIVKPTVEIGFDFHALRWLDAPLAESVPTTELLPPV